MLIGPITSTRQTSVQSALPSSDNRPPTSTNQSNGHGAESPSSTSEIPVINWTAENVQAWLKDKKLGKLCETLAGFDGEYLQELYSDLQEDPKMFKSDMKSDYHMNAKMYVIFKVELSRLFNVKT